MSSGMRENRDLLEDVKWNSELDIKWNPTLLKKQVELIRTSPQELERKLKKIAPQDLRKQEQGSSRAPPKIERAPGSLLLRITDLAFSRKSHEQTFEPIVADWHKEYFDAIDQNRGKLKFFFINARYYLAFVKAIGLDSFFQTIKQIFRPR